MKATQLDLFATPAAREPADYAPLPPLPRRERPQPPVRRVNTGYRPGPPLPLERRFRGCPPICDEANLPGFDGEAEAKAFNEANSHPPIKELWRCRACGCWHYWSVERSDNNGGHRAGAQETPPRILDLMRRTAAD